MFGIDLKPRYTGPITRAAMLAGASLRSAMIRRSQIRTEGVAEDPRQIRTREALKHALLKLLERKALDQITILDICAASGVGYRTFFRHHPTKESLLDEIAAEQIRRLVDLTLPVNDASDVSAGYVALFEYVAEHRALWFALLTGGAAGSMREEFLRLSREIAAARADPDRWPPPDLAVVFTVTSTIEVITWWLLQKKPLSVQEIADIHNHLIVMPAVTSEMKRKRKPLSRAK